MANMMCPKCNKFQEKAETCSSCGIVIAKFKSEPNQQSSAVTSQITIESDLSLKEKFQSLSAVKKALILLACIFLPVLLFLFGELGKVFGIILVVVITFAFLLWPMKKAAEWFGAENATYMHVFLAQIVATVLVIGTGVFAALTGLAAAWILIIIVIGASYSKILGTTFFRGIGITLVGSLLSWIIGYVLSLILGGILGVGSLIYSEENKSGGVVNLEAFEEAAESVCRCGTDTACLGIRMNLLGEMANEFDEEKLSSDENEKFKEYTVRALQCTFEPKPYFEKKTPKKKDPIAKAESKASETPPDTNSRTDTAEEKVAKQVKELKKKAVPVKYEWRKADVSELTQFLNRLIEIETTRDTIRKGFLLELTDDIATLSKSRKAEGLTFAIPLDEIKNIQVYDKVE